MSGILQLGDSFLRLYGHPRLLAIAEQINGPDFTPFTDTIWVKPAGLGASVAWHTPEKGITPLPVTLLADGRIAFSAPRFEVYGIAVLSPSLVE